MITLFSKQLEEIAKEKGYDSVNELLYDYKFIPSVMPRNHEKYELMLLIGKKILAKKSPSQDE